MLLESARKTDQRSYRCYYATSLEVAETGERQYVQLRAPSATSAARLALSVLASAIAVTEVVRIEEAA